MSLWHQLFRLFGRDAAPASRAESPTEQEGPHDQLIELPAEPFVFECRECGKVFEARRKKPLCPECDSHNVTLLST